MVFRRRLLKAAERRGLAAAAHRAGKDNNFGHFHAAK